MKHPIRLGCWEAIPLRGIAERPAGAVLPQTSGEVIGDLRHINLPRTKHSDPVDLGSEVLNRRVTFHAGAGVNLTSEPHDGPAARR